MNREAENQAHTSIVNYTVHDSIYVHCIHSFAIIIIYNYGTRYHGNGTIIQRFYNV